MILVTGGTGLVGSHLLYHIVKKNNNVRAIYRAKERIKLVKNIFSYYPDGVSLFDKINWLQADITDVCSLEKAFEDVSFVYHAAAKISFDEKDYFAMRKINIEGTANIVNLCIDKNVKKLCFVSSIATIGNASKKRAKITESCEWNPEDKQSNYSITKYGAEMEVWRASQEGVPVVVVNPAVIIGTGFWSENTGKLFTQIDKGFNYYTKGVTGFVGVNDVVKAMVLLMESSIENDRFILVSENKSFKEILDFIAESLQKKKPNFYASKLITNTLYRIDNFISKITGKKIALTKDAVKSLHNKHYYSSEKIKKTFDFEFTPMQKVIEEVGTKYLKTTP